MRGVLPRGCRVLNTLRFGFLQSPSKNTFDFHNLGVQRSSQPRPACQAGLTVPQKVRWTETRQLSA